MSLQLWGQRSPCGTRCLSPALRTWCFLLADESPRPGKGRASRKDTCIQVIPPLCHSTQCPGPHSWDLHGTGRGESRICGLGGWAGLCAGRGVVAGDGCQQGTGPCLALPPLPTGELPPSDPASPRLAVHPALALAELLGEAGLGVLAWESQPAAWAGGCSSSGQG